MAHVIGTPGALMQYPLTSWEMAVGTGRPIATCYVDFTQRFIWGAVTLLLVFTLGWQWRLR